MRYAIIEAGVVTNMTLCENPVFAAEQGWVDASSGADIGWTWDGTSFAAPVAPLAERKAALKAMVRSHQARLFAGGWSHDYGAAGVHVLDLRDADDKANWTLLLIKTQGMIGAGAGAYPVTLRTAGNETITLTATEVNAAMAEFLGWGQALLARKWALDTEIDDAADTAALEAIDVMAGWP